ncbi:MAG: DUF6503 family protein [Acidobacteriota bacterium]
MPPHRSATPASPRFRPARPALAGALGLALAGLALGFTPASAEPTRDAKAIEIAERTLEAMGVAQAWQNTRFVRFEFFGFRLHHWDRHTGRHRMEGTTREGQEYVVLHDVENAGEGGGSAWLDGEALEGDRLADWVKNAYRAWINDTYWLTMPYKLLDPGVNLSYDGEETLDGATYDKLKLTFEGVGLTPGDTYWAYIDRESGLMGRWAYSLQGWDAETPPTEWRWLDWARYGEIQLASKRFDPAKEREATLDKIAVFKSLPDSVFTSAAPVTAAAPAASDE